MKLGLQLLVSFFVTLILIELSPDRLRYGIAVPFLKDNLLTMGLLYVPFAMLVIVGSSNAVNLTDGLDGLAIVPVMIVARMFWPDCLSRRQQQFFCPMQIITFLEQVIYSIIAAR